MSKVFHTVSSSGKGMYYYIKTYIGDVILGSCDKGAPQVDAIEATFHRANKAISDNTDMRLAIQKVLDYPDEKVSPGAKKLLRAAVKEKKKGR